MERLVPLALLTAYDLDSGASVETGVVDCRFAGLDHLILKGAQSSGVGDLRIQVALSTDGVTFNNYDAQSAVIASTNTAWTGAQPEDSHSFLCTDVAPFLKFKITDLASLNNYVIDFKAYLKEI